MESGKKILITAPLFVPQIKGGGPILSIKNLVDVIEKDFTIFILSHNHEVNSNLPLTLIQNGWNKYSNSKVYYFRYKQDNIFNVYKIIGQVKPKIIYVNSFFSFNYFIPSLLYSIINQHNCSIVVAPRGELCINTFKLKKIKKRFYFNFFKYFGFLKKIHWHITSISEKMEMDQLLGKNWVYSKISNITKVNNIGFVNSTKKNGFLNMVFMARIQKKKNLLFALEILFNVKNNVTFHIYGPIEDLNYWNECLKVIKNLPSNIVVIYKGFVEHNIVPSILRNYDCMFFPTMSENYGHSIVEALFCGLPIILSDQTPWNDLTERNAGFVIPLQQKKKFSKAIEHFANMSDDNFKQIKKNAITYISNKMEIDLITRKYIDLFNKV